MFMHLVLKRQFLYNAILTQIDLNNNNDGE